MRIKLTLLAKYLTLPRDNQHILQGIIYHNLSENVAEYLHNQDSLKMFTFSQIYGDFWSYEGLITFKDKAYVHIGIADENIMQDLINNLNRKKLIMLGAYAAKILKIEEENYPLGKSRISVRFISPVILKQSMENYTMYYSPEDNSYSDIINEGLHNRFNTLESIEISNIRNVKKKVIKYKNQFYESYSYRATLSGDPMLLAAVYDTGIGHMCSSGFGMFEIENND